MRSSRSNSRSKSLARIAQRGREAENVVAERAEDDAVAVGDLRDAFAQLQRGIEATLRRLVGDELQRSEQTSLARIANERMFAQLLQALLESRRLRDAVREQPAFVIQTQHFQRDRSAHRMRRVSLAVTDDRVLARPVGNAVVHFFRHQYRAHRRVTGRQALGDRHEVRLDAFGFASEQRSGAAEAGDHFVDDEQECPGRGTHRASP